MVNILDQAEVRAFKEQWKAIQAEAEKITRAGYGAIRFAPEPKKTPEK